MATPSDDVPTAPPPTTPEAEAGRPTGVTIIAILFWLSAAFAILGGAALLLGSFFFGAPGGAPAGAAGFAFVGGLFLLALGLFEAWTGWGLWTRQRWAWTVALVLAGVSLVLNLVTLIQGEILSSVLGLLIAGVILWYLFRPEVQAWFGAGARAPWATRA